MTTGIIDVGGGMRGAYTAGVYDYLHEQGIELPYCIGVSAGAANQITYLARQHGRNLRYYEHYILRPQYMGLGCFLRQGNYLNLDYIYSTMSNEGGEDPLDYDAFSQYAGQYTVVATNALTGEPHYFTKADIPRNRYDAVKASCALPGVNKPYVVNGTPYYDGGISDPVPYRKALSDGCEKLVLLLTRPQAMRRGPGKNRRLMRHMMRRYPAANRALERRHLVYNQAVDDVLALQAQGKALVLAPADIDGMSTLTRNTAAILRLYRMGYEDAKRIPDFL